MSFRAFLYAFALTLLGSTTAIAQEQDLLAIKRLAFLSGSWHCSVQGRQVPHGDVESLTYEFSPDWSWMVERADLRENGKSYWSVQLWGYDARQKRLVANQFTSAGILTKSVDGWIDGRFQSRRDDNGATVTMRPISRSAFDWVIESADHSSVVTESCTR